jgi:hypothetical protein
MKALIVLAALALAGCGTTKTVYVPTSCVPKDYPPRPEFTDTDPALAAAPDFAHRYQLLAGNHAARVARADANEKLIEACR